MIRLLRLLWLALVPLCAVASPEIDRLADLASKGDATALGSLVEIARRNRDADAEYALGVMAYEGRGLEKNPSQAFRLIERASAKGHADASNTLGFFYEHGVGTPVDLAQALASYRRGAQAGSSRARTNLGWFYEKGIGVAKDSAVAADWYKMAAEQGLAAAQANLARLYESGNGVTENPMMAIELYKTALAGGLPSAALGMGRLLESRGKLAEAADNYVIAAKAQVPESDWDAGRLLVSPANPRRNVAQGVGLRPKNPHLCGTLTPFSYWLAEYISQQSAQFVFTVKSQRDV